MLYYELLLSLVTCSLIIDSNCALEKTLPVALLSNNFLTSF